MELTHVIIIIISLKQSTAGRRPLPNVSMSLLCATASRVLEYVLISHTVICLLYKKVFN